MKAEIWCKSCYKVSEYDTQKQEPQFCSCGMKFSSWHVAQQLQRRQPEPILVRK